MKEVSIGHLVRSINGRFTAVLWAVRQRGLGCGLYGPYGGDLFPNENPLDGLIREIKVESGLTCTPEDVEPAGVMEVAYFSGEGKDQHLQSEMQIHVYLVHDWMGTPRETPEMGRPTFFPLGKLPLQNTLEGNVRVLRRIVTGKTIYATMEYQLPGFSLVRFLMSDGITRFPRRR